jgi:hypothetical protein
MPGGWLSISDEMGRSWLERLAQERAFFLRFGAAAEKSNAQAWQPFFKIVLSGASIATDLVLALSSPMEKMQPPMSQRWDSHGLKDGG